MQSYVQLESDSDSDSSDDDEPMHVMIPHEGDTEDIFEGVNPENYDHRHSKSWNALVDKKAKEMEDLEQMQINMKKKAKQSKEEAELKAAKLRAKEHQTKLMQMKAEKHAQIFKNPDVNFSEMYGSMSPDLL